MWSSSEAEKSSTWRALEAVHFALTSFKDSVQGKSVKWYSDNQGTVRIVDIGSPNAEFHYTALDILISVEVSMFGLLLSGFPESLMLLLMTSTTSISTTGILPNSFLPI